ncbi:hypothetical protein [Gluconobacter cerinus]|uniref:hypothetical protein n=1 Tax=Gluconobacter cerinus TaxID=38307 RepID=UPI003AB3EDAA
MSLLGFQAVDISGFDLSGLLADIPARYELWVALLIIGCKLITVFLPPPQNTSRFGGIYRVITLLGLNFGWATNRLERQVGKVTSASGSGESVKKDASLKS